MCLSGRCSACARERAEQRNKSIPEPQNLAENRAKNEQIIRDRVAALPMRSRAIWDQIGDLVNAGLLETDPRVRASDREFQFSKATPN